MTGAAPTRAPRNRTLVLSDTDAARLAPRLARLDGPTPLSGCMDRTILGDSLRLLPLLPRGAFDLVIADPPYNLSKSYAGTAFRAIPPDAYEHWLRSWLALVRPLMAARASIYLCCEWRCSAIVQRAAEAFFTIRNRITWEREKGRGAARNWKNCSEDIWFCTASDDHYFDVEAVKLRRKVVAPYRHGDGTPKDWCPAPEGDYRTTSPSNLWTDLSVPFWSMPENTDHPAQKPEKLVAKLILASCPPGGVVLDPFLGSGTTSVVARKLGRHFVGIEIEPAYCVLAERRLELSRDDRTIQGYVDGVFWERNSLPTRSRQRRKGEPHARGDQWLKDLA